MALPAGGIFEARATATAGNLNSGGFNPENVNFLTDLTTDALTGNTASPIVSSGSYAFQASDVGAKVFIQSTGDWNPGWYPIVSVASNKATLNAIIGDAVSYTSATRQLTPSTVLGVSTVGTPVNGVFGIDYSQQDTAKLAITDLAINAVTNTSVTSAALPFDPAYVGNFLHTTAGTGFTKGWFEIINVVGSVATLDRSAGTLASTGGTSALGGALSFNSTLDNDAYGMMVAGNILFFRFGTFIIGETISTGLATAILLTYYEGYNAVRGDRPLASDRPTLSTGAFTVYVNDYKNTRNLIISGTSSSVYGVDTGSRNLNCKFLNTSTVSGRDAIVVHAGQGQIVDACEMVSQNGTGIKSTAVDTLITGCYIHDSLTGLSAGAIQPNTQKITGSIFENCSTSVLFIATNVYAQILGNTFYGQNIPIGVGINLITAPSNFLKNNIFYGFATAISQTTSPQPSTISNYNNFYNNTIDRTNVATGPNDLAVDPVFAGAVQITGSTATSSGSVLTQSGGDFSTVEDNVDYLTVVSGTGVTTGKYLIASHTGTTLTTAANALGTSVAGDIVYRVGTGHNFAIGTNLKAAAHTLPSFGTTSYVDLGAVQRQESGGASSFAYVG